jgi:hypothetical protein
MMRYTVVWDKEVEDPFMNAWLAADRQRRAVLTGIANWIDRQLAVDAEIKGQALSDPLHRVIEATVPNSTTRVSVTYRVFRDDRQVRVTLVVIRDR